LVKNKLHIAKEWHISPSEIDKLVFYEYEWILEEINIIQKEQEKRNKEEEKKYANLENAYKQPKVSMPSMPKINMPKI
jgi:hypothetical protein